MVKLLKLLLVLLATAKLTLSAENGSLTNITPAEGLAGETVYRIMTDHSGHVWIAASSGVNVYNGKRLIAFRITGSEGQLLTVNDLCETQSHQIVAATEEGLYRLDHERHEFQPMLPEVKHPISLLAVGDTLYIGGEQGFMMYDGERLTHIDIGASRHGLDNIVRQYIVGTDGLIWFLGRHNLNSYDPRTGKTTHHELPVKDMILTRFAQTHDGRFVIGTRNSGLYIFDLRANTIGHIDGIGNIISTVERSSDGYICVATDGAGAFLLDGKTLSIVRRFNTQGEDTNRLPTDGTYCYYRDACGVDWFGFVRYGLCYSHQGSHLFRPYSLGEFTTEGINVRSFSRRGDHLLVGTQSGFYDVNTQSGQWHYYSSDDMGGGHIVNVITWYEGQFYVGTFDGGMRIFDPQRRQLLRQTFHPQLDKASIGDIKVDHRGRLWIGSSIGLMMISDGKLQKHFTEQNSHIVGGLILSITFGADGSVWATGEDGCSIYSEQSGEIVVADFPQGFFNRRPWMRGASGHDGLVFMRTGPQTFYTDPQMKNFGELHLPVNLVDKWSRNFIDDMKGYYWIDSEKGLFRFDYQMGDMLHIGMGDLLPGTFINDMSLDADGTLWVGTSQGLYYAGKKAINQWQHFDKYKVQLFNIRRGSDLLSPSDEYLTNEQHAIRLGWNFTSEVLQAEPVLLDYAQQEERLYEWRVDGGAWNLASSGEQIAIRRLMMGSHTLEVRLAGAEGTTSSFGIIVMPSTGAIAELLVLFLAGIAVFVGYRYRKNTRVLLNERDEILDTLVEIETHPTDSEEASIALSAEDTIVSPTRDVRCGSRYQKVRIDEEECREIVSRMKAHIEQGRVYTNADLKMKDLADVLRLSAPKLSQVFNLYLGENYYDFINRYRLEEFKRLIAEGKHKQYTITALSEQCGFKRSNFFSTFRKVEGMTPAEYLKKEGVKV